MASKNEKSEIKKLLKKAVKSEMPRNISPMHFKLAPAAFSGEEWQYEIKWDGFRTLAYLQNGEVELRSRNNNSFNKRFSRIKEELQQFKINAVLDGEIVALDENGFSDFDRLLSGEKQSLTYFVFDILWYDGFDVTNLPLFERRLLLEQILPHSPIIRFSSHIEANGNELFELAKTHNIEGVVAKKKESVYVPGSRTKEWLKIKTGVECEAVVAGLFLDRDKEGSGFSSLIIGLEEKGNYKYIGLVERGLSPATLKKILATASATHESIFVPVPTVNRKGPFRNKKKNPEIIWLEPTIICKVKYLELDKNGLMRHASFRGLIGL